MKNDFGYKAGKTVKALELDGYYVWDCSVIKSGGKYHMFSSRWKEEYGFGWNWLFNSEIIHSVSDTPEGPTSFKTSYCPAAAGSILTVLTPTTPALRNITGNSTSIIWVRPTVGTSRPART